MVDSMLFYLRTACYVYIGHRRNTARVWIQTHPNTLILYVRFSNSGYAVMLPFLWFRHTLHWWWWATFWIKTSWSPWSSTVISLWKAVSFNASHFHASLSAFVVIIFVQCTVSSMPAPSAALLCTGLCNPETDLNTFSTVIVPLNTVHCLQWHSGPLSYILAQCLLPSPLKATAGQSDLTDSRSV